MAQQERLTSVKHNYMTEHTRQVLYERIKQYTLERETAQLALGAAAGRESDWHDNAAYDIANEQFNLAYAHLMNTQKQLERVCIIEPRKEVADAQLGNVVQVQFTGESEIESFTLLGNADASVRKDWLSNESPLGKAIFGKKVGEHAKFSVDGKHHSEVVIHAILPGNF